MPARTRRIVATGWTQHAGSLWRVALRASLSLTLGAVLQVSAYSQDLSKQTSESPRLTEEQRPVIGFPFLRYDEDWTFLRDATRRTDTWDRFKYMPMNETGTAYVSLGGEARQVYEWYHNQYWGDGPQDGNGWLTQRYMMHADVHLGSRFRVFGQLQSALGNGRSGGPRPYDKDKLDLHEAFVDYKQPIGDRTVTFRLGRQEMIYGSGRLIEAREGLNTRISFDGVKVLGSFGKLHVDGFAVRPTLQKSGFFDDTPDSKRMFWGVYATRPIVGGSSLDLYYLGLDSKLATFDQGSGHAVRHTFGGRWAGSKGRADFDDELIGQLGSFSGGDIRAWAVAVEHGFTFSNTPTAPRISLRSDVASGDNDAHDRHLGTFSPLFPKGKYFGEADLNGPSNTIDLLPAIAVHVTRSATFTTSYGAFWRESRNDGLYGFATNLEKTGQLSRAHFTGKQAEVDLDYLVNSHLVVRAVYQHFFAGDFLKQTPPGKDVNYVTAWFDYHF